MFLAFARFLVAYTLCPSMHIPLRIYIGRLHIVLELISLVVAYHDILPCTSSSGSAVDHMDLRRPGPLVDNMGSVGDSVK